jgi:hypothetical protein
MSKQGRFDSQRARALIGTSVVAVVLAAAGVVVGGGFARSSVTSAQSQYGKIVICHKTHSKKHPFVSISISTSAWPAHQRHGDALGACTTTTTTTTTTSTTTTTTSASQTSAPGRSGEHGNSQGRGRGHGK